MKNKNIDGISGLRDESDGKKGMRVVIELKREANAQVVLNQLFANTQMQTTFGVVLLALVNNQKQPKVLSLREILDEYITYQEEIITRRTRYDLKKAEERAHLLQGLLIALDNIDEVIRTIRESYDDAKQRLMERFGFSDVQAQAILEMQLRRLQGLEKEKLQAEFDELQQKIAYYNELLASRELRMGVLKEELTAIAAKYGDERRTEIQDVEDDLDIEDLIEEAECCYTLSNAGYIKRMRADTYRAQRRGGRGVSGQSLKEEDYVKNLFIGSTHDQILFFTTLGKVHRRKGFQIPEASRTARGTAIVNVLPLEPGEAVTAMVPIQGFGEEYLFMATRAGTVKRIEAEQLNTRRSTGIRALTIDEGDELISVFKTSGDDIVLLASAGGMGIAFHENDVRPMGRDATGVRGIRLDDGDTLIGAERFEPGKCLLSVTVNGFGKRTPVEEYLRLGEGGERVPQSRGGKGMKSYHITEKTGRVAAVRVVSEDDDVMLIESGGTIIRMAASDINVYRRDTQGVTLMRVGDENSIVALERTDKAPEEEMAEETAEE